MISESILDDKYQPKFPEEKFSYLNLLYKVCLAKLCLIFNGSYKIAKNPYKKARVEFEFNSPH